MNVKSITPVLIGWVIFSLSGHVSAYQEISVSDGGSIMGTVYLGGQVPKPKGYNLTTLPDPFYCGRISDGKGWRILQPFNVGTGGEFRETVVYLEGVEKGKAFEEAGISQIEAKDCLFLPFTTVVRDDQSVGGLSWSVERLHPTMAGAGTFRLLISSLTVWSVRPGLTTMVWRSRRMKCCGVGVSGLSRSSSTA